ncbi:MAG: GWxTD domain-containing protein, partial [Candidatus Aminicenantes bacterium]|nr:GWxTD domain-containing protein [Candidatus Aminicenantes bacterium]
MRKHPRLRAMPALLTALVGWFFIPLAAEEAMRADHKQWLEDVSPILSRVERDVFLKLQTDREREVFIRFFWRQRDPTPGTPENEFQKEYQDRVRYADQYFGFGSVKRGSQTERGFYYLLLGPPLERQLYTTMSQIWPQELWFYKGEEQYGLPAYFYLIFYQPEGLGEYRLYYPGVEGPEKLVTPTFGTRAITRDAAYQAIKQVNSELAGASLSYLPGERPLSMASFSSDTIVAAVKQLPDKRVSDAYARTFLSYKDYVETEYSDSYIGNSYQVKVFFAGGQPFLHWTIEPERMNVGQSGGVIYAGFEMVLRLEGPQGQPLHEETDEIPLKLTPDEFKAHERQRFAFQDCLAVIPGTWKVFFLLKNKTGKDFTSLETSVAVPAESGPAALGPLLLYHGRQDAPAAQRANVRAFQFAGRQYVVGARNEFLPQQTMGLYVQLVGGRGGARDPQLDVVWEVVSLDAGTTTLLVKKKLAEALDAEGGLDLGLQSLAALRPGYYRAEVSLAAADGRRALTQKENFIILDRPVPVAPWVYGRLHGPYPGPEHLRVLGSQYFMARDYPRSVRVLEEALKAKDEPATRLLLGKALYGGQRFQDSLAVL